MRIVLTAITVAAVLALLRYLSDVLIPFAAALVLAYMLNPLVTVFERATKRRGPAVAMTIAGLGIVGLALVIILVPLMVGQVDRFRGDLGTLRDDLISSVRTETDRPADTAEQSIEGADEVPADKSVIGWHELKDAWVHYRRSADSEPRSQRLAMLRERVAGTYIGDFLERGIKYTRSDEFSELLISAVKGLAISGWSVVTFALSVILGLTGLIVVLLYLVFLLLDYPEYARSWQAFLPPNYRGPIVEFLEQFDVVLRRYLRGQAVVALLVGGLFSLGFTLVGLPMALPFGLFIGLLNMVPYLQTVAIVPGVVLAGLRAVEGDSGFLVSVALMLLVFAVVQVIQDAVITPRVIGKATGLRPVAILLGVFIWGKLLGVLGLLLAIPLTCLGIAYYRRFVLRHAAEASTAIP